MSKTRLIVLGVSLPLLLWFVVVPPLPQPAAYHHYADERAILGIPFFWNVVSNLPFLAIGLYGCWWLTRPGREGLFGDQRAAYLTFFIAEALTCFGSAYYHAWPTNETLVFDRVVFVM